MDVVTPPTSDGSRTSEVAVPASRTVLQLVRVPALLALLLTAGSYRQSAASPPALADLWLPWAVTTATSVLFVAVLLWGRRERHSAAVLAVEAVLAATLAFVPSLLWLVWLGVYPWTLALLGGTVPALATAWLGVVVARAVWNARDDRASAAD
jgi:hypothetical protein